MGWLYTNDYSGGGVRAYLDRNFASENDEIKDEILKSALVAMSRYYAAVRTTTKETGESKIWALVVLVKYNPKATDGMTLGWKTMDETMGPTIDDCPKSILDLLTDPPANDWATAWRARCRAYHDNKPPRPQPGDILVFPEPLEFSDGTKETRFRAYRYGHRAIRFCGLTTGGHYKIPALDKRSYVIEGQ